MDVPNSPRLSPAKCPKLPSFHLDKCKMIRRLSRSNLNTHEGVQRTILDDNHKFQIQRQLL